MGFTPLPGALLLDPAAGSAPRPPVHPFASVEIKSWLRPCQLLKSFQLPPDQGPAAGPRYRSSAPRAPVYPFASVEIKSWLRPCLFVITELFSLALTIEALQVKTCQDSLLSGGVGQLEPRFQGEGVVPCLLYTSPSPRDRQKSRMPSSA